MTDSRQLRPPAPLAPQDRSLWLAQAGIDGAGPAGDPPARADVAIVGGGFVGLWTAIRTKLASPGTEVVILEAGACGSGASGRNGGFVMTMWSKFGSLRKLCGTDDALAYADAIESAVGGLGRFCAEHGIDAEYHQGGWLWAATSRAQLDTWESTVATVEAAGRSPYERLDPGEVAARSGSPMHLGGIYERAPAIVHPGRLAAGLRRVAAELGVTIVEQCPVSVLSAGGGGAPVLQTPRGQVRAERVVLALAAWAVGLREVRGSLVTIASDVVATPRIPDRLARLGWDRGLSISDSRRLVHYYRQTDDGRIVFGKGGGDLANGDRIGARFDRSGRRTRDVERQLHRTYPMLHDVAVEHAWRGPVDYAFSGLPIIGPLGDHPDVFLAAGFSGNGVGPSQVAGQALAEMVLERGHGQVPEGLRRPHRSGLPPDPVRYLAARTVRAAVERKEDAEDLGRRAPRYARSLAALDPTGLTDRG